MDRTKRLPGIAVLALLFLSTPACDQSITEPDAESDTIICLWVDGVLQCIETAD